MSSKFLILFLQPGAWNVVMITGVSSYLETGGTSAEYGRSETEMELGP